MVELLGIPFREWTEKSCVNHIMESLQRGQGGWVVTPNVHILRASTRDSRSRALVLAADVVVADGMPLIWASRVQGTPLPERVSGSNLIWSISEAAAQRERKIFFLGGQPGTAEAAASILRARNPGLSVAGTLCPPFGFETDEEQIRAIGTEVTRSRPDIVFVALSFPKGELLIEQLRRHLPSTWWIGVGISFSFVSGDVKRAPRVVQRLGLEWLFRLQQEPQRLARRYLLEGLPFVAELLLHSLRRRARQRPTRAA